MHSWVSKMDILQNTLILLELRLVIGKKTPRLRDNQNYGIDLNQGGKVVYFSVNLTKITDY
jgi:hypothetical protein